MGPLPAIAISVNWTSDYDCEWNDPSSAISPLKCGCCALCRVVTQLNVEGVVVGTTMTLTVCLAHAAKRHTARGDLPSRAPGAIYR